MKQNIAIILFSSIALSACATSTESNQKQTKPSPELEQKIQKLVEKTNKNLYRLKTLAGHDLYKCYSNL